LRNRAAALIGAAAILLLSLASTGGSAGAANSTASTIATWRFCSNCVSSGGDLSRYRYVGMNAGDFARITTLKASNPTLKALVYKDMASTRSWSCGGLVSAGLDYCWVNTNHPDWFTLDQTGQRIEWSGFPGQWQMDVGNAAYQSAWAANVISELKANGWDGVVIDNANVDESGYLGGKTMSEYPTQASYQAASRSFLASVCPQVIAAGFLCLPNIQAQPVLANAALWKDWIQFTSGGTREYWTKWNSDTSGRYGDGGWNDLESVFTTVESAGKIFLPVTYAPMSDVASMRYARASFLLRWDGGPSAFLFAPTPEAQDPWSPEWTTEIGVPVGDPVQVGSAWKRAFTGGMVVVNPSSSVTVTVQLGASYSLPGGSTASAVTLAPLSGLVVMGTVATSTPPPATTTTTTSPTTTSATTTATTTTTPTATTTAATTTTTPTTTTAGPITLTAATQGSRAVSLAWRGAQGAKVDVYRNGSLRSTVPNSGSTTDKLPMKANGTFTYRVCQAGTTICSPSVSVTLGTRLLSIGGAVLN